VILVGEYSHLRRIKLSPSIALAALFLDTARSPADRLQVFFPPLFLLVRYAFHRGSRRCDLQSFLSCFIVDLFIADFHQLQFLISDKSPLQ
jgi:hypothetical protein